MLEALITVLPPWINLDSFSIIRLSSLIVSLSIAVYLFKIKGKSIPTLLLAWAFTGGAIFNLSTFLEFAGPYYWQPCNLQNLIIPFLLDLGPSIVTVSFLLFAYYFPHFQKPDKREFRIVLILAVIANLATLGLTFYNFVILERMSSYFGFRMLYHILLYITVGLQLILAVFLLFRKAVLFSSGRSRSVWLRLIKPQGKDARAAWSLALVLLLPLLAVCGYMLMTLGVLPPTIATYIVWLVFLFFYFSFVVTYLNHTEEPTTFQVKLVGVVLVLVVAILGLVAIIVGESYKNDYLNEDLVSDRQTIHFALNRHGSYDISKPTYRFDSNLGSKIEPGYGERERLDLQFPFPFFDQVFKEIHLLHGPMIYLGDEIREDGWGGYHPQPAIAPMIMNVEPARGGGIFYKSEPESMTITWYEVPEFGHDNSNTIQLVLFKDGSFDFTYRELNVETGYSGIQMYLYTTANLTGHHPGAGTESVPSGPKLVGIHSGSEGAALQPVRFSRGLPYSSDSPGVIFEAYDIDFYHYLHNRMSLLMLILVASCIFVLFFFPFLFKASLIKPLQALYKGMQIADSGDLDVYVSPQFNDEIGFLTEYFNHMLQSIKKAEANFWALAENAQDGILIISEEGLTIYANRRASEITGFTFAELMEIRLKELVRSDEFSKTFEQYWKRSEDKLEPGHYEAVIKTKNLLDLPVELTVSKTVWHGKPAGVVIIRDISERKRSEEQARLQQQRLMQTDKLTSLGVLVAGVAHEINNPNQTILSNAALLKRACPQLLSILNEYSEENDEFLIAGLEQTEFRDSFTGLLEGIGTCSKRIDGIVKNLKSFARNEPRNLMTALDINTVIGAAVELVSNFIKRATDHFSLQLEENLPKIRGNAQRIEQVIINLILNACQALSNREKTISICSVYDEGQNTVLIKVRDQGSGIPEEHLARIKDPFFTTRYEAGGTGLGLYVSETIVEEHHGTLGFASEPGKGTEAIITFPVEEG